MNKEQLTSKKLKGNMTSRYQFDELSDCFFSFFLHIIAWLTFYCRSFFCSFFITISHTKYRVIAKDSDSSLPYLLNRQTIENMKRQRVKPAFLGLTSNYISNEEQKFSFH